MVKRLVIVLMVFIGYGEDEPKKVPPRNVCFSPALCYDTR